MRIDGRTNAAQTLRSWSEGLGIPFLGVLRETQLYVRSLEHGMTIFDLSPAMAATDLRQWEPILDWVKPVLYPPQAANDCLLSHTAVVRPASSAGTLQGGIPLKPPEAPVRPPFVPEGSRLGSSLPNSLMPAQESLVHGGRLSIHGPGRMTGTPVVATGKPAMTRNSSSADRLQIPSFLKRAP